MAFLVCGGAGYIGSHCVDKLIQDGKKVIVVDNFSTGHIQAINRKAKIYEGDILDYEFMTTVFKENEIEAVFHFAANSIIPESMSDPLKYYINNIGGTTNLLKVMTENKVNKIIFSSTAAVYGNTNNIPISEVDETNPINVYGETKATIEKIIQSCNRAYRIRYVILRYFNAAGASTTSNIGEYHSPETHLIPLVLQVPLNQRDKISIFGTDYNTEDGTCIRDYIHVEDLIDAHIKALEYLNEGNSSDIFNLGSGTGCSVKQIIDTAEEITGQKIRCENGVRRDGDPEVLIASNEKAKILLNWEPKHNIYEIISSAWNFHKNNPNGYNNA